MWVFLKDSFLSIVEDISDIGGNTLLVRARIKGDIEKVFPDVKVKRTTKNDYLFRAWVERNEVAHVMAQQVQGIVYSNFKDEVKKHDKSRMPIYHRVWAEMADMQDQKAGRKKPWLKP